MVVMRAYLKKYDVIFHVLLLLISAWIFSLVFIPREVRFIKTISVLARYNNTRFLPLIALLLLGALSIKNQRFSAMVVAIVIFPAFALALNGLWAGAYSENNVISGLIPRTDAFSFYGGAVSLIETGYLSSYTKRRPLFGGFLAFVLWMTSGHLQITLAILTYLLAFVTFLSILEMRRFLNPLAAVVYFIVLFLFIRRYIGITMSENMGILLGVSAFTLFLAFIRANDANHKKQRTYFLASAFVFSLAQVSRPGAFATLPLLILFAGWFFRSERKWSWKWAALTAVVIVAAFLVNTAVFRLTTVPGSSQMNNVGFGIYGLAIGGKGWEQIFVDHPELNLLSGEEYERAVFRYIWQAISSNPFKFIKGMWVQTKTLFSFAEANSMYSFAWSKNRIISYVLIAFIYLLSIGGLIMTYVRKNRAIGLTLLLFGLGFFGSLVVAPAYQTRHMRVYAASLPFLGFLPAVGTSYLTELLPEKIRALPLFTAIQPHTNSQGALVFTAILVFVIILGPLATGFLAPGDVPPATACLEGEDAVVMAYYPGSTIRIYRNDPSITTWVPILTQLDYKGSIHSICCDQEIIYFENIPAPNTMYPALNLLTGKLMYMIAHEDLLPDGYGYLQACGRIEDVLKQRADSGFFYPSTIQILQ